MLLCLVDVLEWHAGSIGHGTMACRGTMACHVTIACHGTSPAQWFGECRDLDGSKLLLFKCWLVWHFGILIMIIIMMVIMIIDTQPNLAKWWFIFCWVLPFRLKAPPDFLTYQCKLHVYINWHFYYFVIWYFCHLALCRHNGHIVTTTSTLSLCHYDAHLATSRFGTLSRSLSLDARRVLSVVLSSTANGQLPMGEESIE